MSTSRFPGFQGSPCTRWTGVLEQASGPVRGFQALCRGSRLLLGLGDPLPLTPRASVCRLSGYCPLHASLPLHGAGGRCSSSHVHLGARPCASRLSCRPSLWPRPTWRLVVTSSMVSSEVVTPCLSSVSALLHSARSVNRGSARADAEGRVGRALAEGGLPPADATRPRAVS